MTTTPYYSHVSGYADAQNQRAELEARVAALEIDHERRRPGLSASEARTADREHQSALAELRQAADHLDDRIRQLGEQPDYNVVSTRGVRTDDSANRAILRPEERMTDWARSQRLIPEDHERGERPLEFGRYIRGMCTGNWQDADMERRALSEGTLSAGGYAVPTILSSQLIDLARNKTRVLQAGAQLAPMANSTVDIAKWAGDPTATWHSENTAVTPTDATLARVRLTAKALMSITVASRELIEDAEPMSVNTALSEAFAAQFALTVDTAALYGTGVAPQPTGVKLTSGVTVTPLATNGASLTNWDPLVNAVFRVRSNNEDPNGVIYSPRTAKNFALLKDTTNQPLNPPAYLDGISRYETAQIPTNLVVGTSGTTTSDMFVADWRQLIVGVRTSLQIQVLTERYAEFGQYGFVAWWRGDIAVARTAAFDVTTGIL